MGGEDSGSRKGAKGSQNGSKGEAEDASHNSKRDALKRKASFGGSQSGRRSRNGSEGKSQARSGTGTAAAYAVRTIRRAASQ